MKNETNTKDNVRVVLKGPDGNIKQEVTGHNLVVNAGLAHIADRLQGTPSQGAMTHMAIGTGNTAPAAGNTALGTELDRTTFDSFDVSGNTATFTATWGAGDGTGAITEYGIFNDASAGTMLARYVDDVVNKGASDTLEVTWSVELNAGA